MTNDLLEYWKERRESSCDGYTVLDQHPNTIVIRVFETIYEDDRTWTDSWLEECVRGIDGNHEIYYLALKKLK